MAAPKYRYYPKDNNKNSSQAKTEKSLKQEVELYISQINDTLKQPGMARKAALIIEELIKKTK